MDAGSGPFPHHAWWQIGWITDYLLAEASLRSDNAITFPRGFITPKVGPHQTYGFAPGKVYGNTARLLLREGLVRPDNPNVDYLCALATDKNRLLVVLLNSQARPLAVQVPVDLAKLKDGKNFRLKGAALTGPDGKPRALAGPSGQQSVNLEGFGLAVLALDFEEVKK